MWAGGGGAARGGKNNAETEDTRILHNIQMQFCCSNHTHGAFEAAEAEAEGGLFSRASSAVVAVEKAAAFINCNELKRWGKERKEKEAAS